MDEQNSANAQAQRSRYWFMFSILCIAGSIMASMITTSAVQRYRAQQHEFSRQLQEINRQLQERSAGNNLP
jgi:hypothetical protein